MKKITIYIAMALLCLNFKAQAQDNKAVDVTLKGIQIGQKVPDITISNLHNYKDANGKPATTAKLSDFKGKLLILDFWATWCSPCIAMIPKMDSLQKQFGDKIQFLSVTYQTEKEVLPFLEKLEQQQKKHYDLPVVTNSKELHKLFPHVYLPHYVWIDGERIVRAITSYKEINEKEINSYLQTGKVTALKNDEYLPYDLKQPFSSNLSGLDIKQTYSSTLTKYVKGVSPVMDVSLDSLGDKKITVLNCPLVLLYGTSLMDKFIVSKSRLAIETADSSYITSTLKGKEYLKWLNKAGFCYELKVEASLAKNIYAFMRDDLSKLFPKYSAFVEKRDKEIYILKRTSSTDKIRTSGEVYSAKFNLNGCKMVNTYLIQLISELNMVYQQKSPYPIIDGTDYKGKVDIELDANLSDIVSLNKALKKYDLVLQKSVAPIEILVIKDALNVKAK